MIEFFEKNLGFFIVVTIVASFVIWSVHKERREEGEGKKKKDKNTSTKKGE